MATEQEERLEKALKLAEALMAGEEEYASASMAGEAEEESQEASMAAGYPSASMAREAEEDALMIAEALMAAREEEYLSAPMAGEAEEESQEASMATEEESRAALLAFHAESERFKKVLGKNDVKVHIRHRDLSKGILQTVIYIQNEDGQQNEDEKTYTSYILSTGSEFALCPSLHHDKAKVPRGGSGTVKSVFSFDTPQDLEIILLGTPSRFVGKRVYTKDAAYPKRTPITEELIIKGARISQDIDGNPVTIIEYESRSGKKKYIEIQQRRSGQDAYEYFYGKNRPYFSEEMLAEVMYAFLIALDNFHKKGYIHYDIKLENIMYYDGVANLVDFGTSFHTERDKDKLPYGGTKEHMSPEQKTLNNLITQYPSQRNRPKRLRKIDSKTDIYSMGHAMDELFCDVMGENAYFASPFSPLIEKMRTKREDRPTADDALNELDQIIADKYPALAAKLADKYKPAAPEEEKSPLQTQAEERQVNKPATDPVILKDEKLPGEEADEVSRELIQIILQIYPTLANKLADKYKPVVLKDEELPLEEVKAEEPTDQLNPVASEDPLQGQAQIINNPAADPVVLKDEELPLEEVKAEEPADQPNPVASKDPLQGQAQIINNPAADPVVLKDKKPPQREAEEKQKKWRIFEAAAFALTFVGTISFGVAESLAPALGGTALSTLIGGATLFGGVTVGALLSHFVFPVIVLLIGIAIMHVCTRRSQLAVEGQSEVPVGGYTALIPGQSNIANPPQRVAPELPNGNSTPVGKNLNAFHSPIRPKSLVVNDGSTPPLSAARSKSVSV